MKFQLDMDADINGTCLQGYIKLTYDQIVAAFGEGDGFGDKTTQEWMFESDTGEVFTLYDWKTSTTPMHEYEWHIGAKSGTNVAAFKTWLTKQVKG
jgi:hypothetical protein